MPSNDGRSLFESHHRRQATPYHVANQAINVNFSESPMARPRKPRPTPLSLNIPVTSIVYPSTKDMPASPGEIITSSVVGIGGHNTDTTATARTDEEKYRDLNGADLIIVIDMQQSLLDQLNMESRDFNGRFRSIQATVQALTEENDQLHHALNMKIKHANMDQLLAMQQRTDEDWSAHLTDPSYYK